MVLPSLGHSEGRRVHAGKIGCVQCSAHTLYRLSSYRNLVCKAFDILLCGAPRSSSGPQTQDVDGPPAYRLPVTSSRSIHMSGSAITSAGEKDTTNPSHSSCTAPPEHVNRHRICHQNRALVDLGKLALCFDSHDICCSLRREHANTQDIIDRSGESLVNTLGGDRPMRI